MEDAAATRLKPAAGRRFGLSVGLAFLTIGMLFWWRDHMHVALSAAMVGALLSIAGLLVPSHLGPIQTAWLGLAGLLSRVTTPIFMGLVYFGVLTPTGVLIRLFGRNPLTRHHRNDSLWVSRDSEDSRQGSMKRQF